MVVVVNNYVPAPKPPVVLPNPGEPYDLNFRFPVRELESDKIRLVPFVPSIYAQPYFEAQLHPELLRYLPWHPSTTLHDFEVYYERDIRSNPASCSFAILDKSKLTNEADPLRFGHAFAGMIGYYQATPESASVEIRPVIVLPKYQRTFVTTHAIGLLLQYALEPPAGCRGQNSNPNGGGGLGLRRVEGYANVKNSPSIRAMERMGMNVEGIIRWDRTVDVGKDVGIPREGDTLQRPGRHSVISSMCWDVWESGGREHVLKTMARSSQVNHPL